MMTEVKDPTNKLSSLNEKIDRSTKRFHSTFRMNRSTTQMLLLLVGTFAVFAIANPETFLSLVNVQNMALAVPEIGLLSIAMMISMVTGGIDLSLVSIANLTAITISTTFTAVANSDPAMAENLGILIILLGILVGVAAGAFNGFLIAKIGVTPILATLGTMQIFNGLAVVWTGGKTLYGSPSALTAFGVSAVAGIPTLFFVFLAVALVVGFLLNRTPLGLRLELQGANPVAARYSGIKSSTLLMRSYVLTGFIGALAGVVFIARNPTASADYGASYVLLVIVIAVLGGTNPSGGYATVFGVFLAALTLQIVRSGFTAMRLSPFQYAIAQGVILVAVLVIDKIDWRKVFRRSTPKKV
ncbi:ABC transporter permease [Actinotignum sp. GS-2025f]|uniref:ABC transporter permease n=2 Tax=Actinomycetaceae TaxID=2049 RepID=UPI002A815B45|nr:ABC transporter permease [Actinotignum sp. SLA_B059]MDY5127835.1 ABC transporter permease [Actinotignum sp. SLA_B059]